MNGEIAASEQQIIVRERLRLLSIGCYIRGGIIAAFSSFFLIYVAFFVGMTFIPDSAWTDNSTKSSPAPSGYSATPSPTPAAKPQPPPKALFRILGAVMGCFVLAGWTLGGLTAYAGWCIHKRKHKALIYVMAGFNCLFVPYGTLLGICLILVMSSPAGRLEFGNSTL